MVSLRRTTRHHPEALLTRKREPSFIDAIPPTAWRIPPDEWILSLRKYNGEKVIRTVRGTLEEARAERDKALEGDRYESAWLIESDKRRL